MRFTYDTALKAAGDGYRSAENAAWKDYVAKANKIDGAYAYALNELNSNPNFNAATCIASAANGGSTNSGYGPVLCGGGKRSNNGTKQSQNSGINGIKVIAPGDPAWQAISIPDPSYGFVNAIRPGFRDQVLHEKFMGLIEKSKNNFEEFTKFVEEQDALTNEFMPSRSLGAAGAMYGIMSVGQKFWAPIRWTGLTNLFGESYLQNGDRELELLRNTLWPKSNWLETGTNFSSTIGVGSAYGALGAWAWGRIGLPTMEIAVGEGFPLHVGYQVNNSWFHAQGSQFFRMIIARASSLESIFFPGKAWFTFEGLPILFPGAITIMVGTRGVWSCVTAAGHAFLKGWFPFIP